MAETCFFNFLMNEESCLIVFVEEPCCEREPSLTLIPVDSNIIFVHVPFSFSLSMSLCLCCAMVYLFFHFWQHPHIVAVAAAVVAVVAAVDAVVAVVVVASYHNW